jgi:LCP family protein required for cell wall assembly
MAKKSKYIDGLRPRVAKNKKPVKASHGANFSRQSSIKTASTRATSKKSARKQDDSLLESPAKRKEVAEIFDSPIDPLGANGFEIDDEELFSDQKEGRKNAQKEDKPKKKKWSKKRKVLLVFLLLLLGGIGVLYFWGNDIIARLTGGNSSLFDAFITAVTDKDTPLKTDANGRTNVLVFGTSGYNMDGSGHDGAQLTDSIMVISLDQETKDIAMLSLPRDLKVGYTCTASGKINEVYWCNNQEEDDEDGGARALMNEVEDILGIDLQYYVHMNWGALVQLVDTLGGITVTLDEDIADTWTNTYIDAGVPTKLDGERALGLARARHGTESGDFSRGASQQKIMIAIKDRLVEKGLSLTETVNLLNVLGDNLRMSASIDEVKTIAKIAQDFPMENLRQVPLLGTSNGDYMTTATIGGISYVVPAAGVGVYKPLQSYIARMFSSDPTLREDASIMVLNGSNVSGVATTEGTKLEQDGFNISIIGDAPAGEYADYVLYDVSNKNPATRATLEERYGIQAKSGEPTGVWVGESDFVLIIGEGAAE